MSQDRDPNQGEGDRISARRYDYVEREPEDAVKAEERAKRGPSGTRVSVDELVAKGHNVIERIRPVVDRMVGNIRSRFGRK